MRYLVYPTLLVCNISNSAAQGDDVVDAECRYTCDDRFGDDIRAIVQSANPDFQNCSINLQRILMSDFEMKSYKKELTLFCIK